jgi:RNA polymerase sigma-70 factor (ECF subfamily)
MDAETRFATLFAEVYPALQRYARYRGLRGADADDLVAETLTVAWRRLDDVPDDDPIPWLFAVARNLWRNDRRRDGRRRRIAAELPIELASAGRDAAPPDEPASLTETRIGRALAHLSDADQEVLRLVVWDGLTAAQAGVVLGRRAGAVRVRLHRARNRLAQVLGAAETPLPPATGPGHDDPDKETVDGPIN